MRARLIEGGRREEGEGTTETTLKIKNPHDYMGK